jgi:hypothetical protein
MYEVLMCSGGARQKKKRLQESLHELHRQEGAASHQRGGEEERGQGLHPPGEQSNRQVWIMKETPRRRRTVTSSSNKRSTDQLENRVVVRGGGGVFIFFNQQAFGRTGFYSRSDVKRFSFIGRIRYSTNSRIVPILLSI